MYEKFFFLKEKPFHITPDPKFLYLSKKHREAIDLLSFGVGERKGFILLTGEVGTGKTTLCRALLEKLPKNTESALILNPVLSEDDLLKTVTADFGLEPGGDSAKDHLDVLNRFLLKKAASRGAAVVIIDEAQNLNPATLEMIRLLSNLETEKEKLLQIVLVGQPELRDKLSLPELRQLNQRVIVRYHLNPLDLQETRAYIENRLKVAGGGNLDFREDAIRLVFEKSQGIPRMINIVCDRALTAAFIDEKRVIDAETVKKAASELEDDGYLKKDGEAPVSDTAPAYSRYMAPIVLSAFVLAFIAGLFIGPEVYNFTVHP
ncbi:MAG: AAA family ATPase [Deltaproteobacteria bacterium]|nr:AAA family ATPase [Deltaproteobacteria bacterium]